MTQKHLPSHKAYRRVMEYTRIGNRAVGRAQAENRRPGRPAR